MTKEWAVRLVDDGGDHIHTFLVEADSEAEARGKVKGHVAREWECDYVEDRHFEVEEVTRL